jgi:ATP-binding cassette, subfamily B, multidrug efflux pump
MFGPGHFRRVTEASEDKPKNNSKVLKRLLGMMADYKLTVVFILLATTAAGATQGFGPYLIGRAVDQFISKGDSGGLATNILILIGVYLVGMISMRFQTYLTSKMGQQILASLRIKVFEKIQSLSLQFLESSMAGELMSRLVNDIDALNNFFSQALPQMLGSIFGLIGIVVAMLSLNWQMGVAVMIMVPVLLAVTQLFSKWARNAFRKTRETLGDVSSGLEEELGGVKVAQAFNRTGENVRRFAERNAANRDANVSANAVTSAFAPAMDVLGTLDMALVAAMGGAMVLNGMISVGVVVAFLQYVQNFFRPITMMAQLWTLAQSAFAAAERVFELLDRVADVQDLADARPIGTIQGKVAFEHVTFGYDVKEPALKDVSFSAEPGQLMAVVGPTGAGKTTLAGLLLRFYDPQAGRVLIDGLDVKDVSQHSLRSQVGVVTQEPFLFSGTIMDNIRYGRLEASDEEIIEAAKMANADSFIQTLPNGYHTDTGERGKLLSQGQRQLIAIARAILANPRLLILDEATANIDTRTEVLIQKAMQNLMKNRTSFVIAHRLSTIRRADMVLVINDGEIVERGKHDDLIKNNGLYADLYQRQFYDPSVIKQSMN